ncbi:thermonuclease family protein [Pelagibacteraceae bacterium]|nr:thermonuclease family protein [Pelagibacteraceae bacterium]
MAVKILIFNLLFILICFSAVSSGKTIFGKAKVIDGDTIHIYKNKIRLHAIDAPETNQTCNKNNKVWSCGIESTKFLKKLIGKNKIECITTGKDQYNRFIGICYKNNLDLNSEMVLNGWAIAYRYYSMDYVEEEEVAKQQKKGIWSGEFEEPYLFRKKNK